MKHNILYASVIAFILIAIETYFRIESEMLENFIKPSNYLEIFLIFFIISFLPKKIANIFISFISIIFITEIIHYSYFGYFLFPMEFILLFIKYHEILETGSTVLNILILPTVFVILIFIFIKIANKLSKHRIIYNKSKYILLLFIIIPIINTAIHYKKRSLGDRPNTNKSIIKNGLYVTKAFLGKTLPLYLFDIQTVKPYQNKDFENSNNQHQAKNVILIIGESLSLHYMSLYGYDKDTTPNLKKLQKNDRNFIALKIISGGVFTDTSVPMLLNVEKQPNAISHILTNKTNLFKLAKDNEYTTHWISAQANDGFSYIRSYMGLKYIDNYIDSSKYGFDKYTSGLDDILIKELKNIDFGQKNLIVLNMIGSHEPYETRVIKTFKPFGNNNHLDNYCNTVAYTDLILNNIIKFIKKQNQKIIFIFTSDHGQHVTKQSLGKGNLNDIRDYQVPTILYNHNIKIDNKISKILNYQQYNSHYNIGLIIAYYLGYETLNYVDLNKAYVNGNELSGNGGFCEYNLKTNKSVVK